MCKKIFARQSPNIDLKDFKSAFRAIKSKEVVYGPLIEDFERRFSEYTEIKYVGMLNMGRTAEWVALKAMDFSEGDEIIMPSYNFPIVPILVKMSGLKPVFVDVEPDTFNIDPSLIEERVTSKTKAILITHMCGHPCEMDKIIDIKNKYGLRLIEDAVHSLGAEYKGKKVGTFGDVSYFSFYVGKTMTTFMGAAVGTNDGTIFNRIKDIVCDYKRLPLGELFKAGGYGALTYFLTKPTIFSLTVYPVLILLNAYNSHLLDARMEEPLLIPERLHPSYLTRFSNLQAAVGLSQLERLQEFIYKRIRNSRLLSQNIEPSPLISLPLKRAEVRHTFLYYFIREKIGAALEKAWSLKV